MLVQFMVKNVLSFKDEAILDMTAINAYKEHECNLIDIGIKEKFVRVAAIYGANASGKSNLNIAMDYFQRIIVESLKNLNTNRTVTIFERTTDFVEFGPSVRKHCQAYQEQVPPETLVLSFFNKLKMKTDVFRTLYSYIMDTLVVPSDFCEDTGVLETFLPRIIDQKKEKLTSFLNAIDTGIKDIEYDDSEKEIKFFTYHLGKDKELYPLSLYSESEGTLKSIMLFIYAQIALLGNKSIFVDELNIKLHPLLLKFIVDLFYDEKSTAQLIYTTHDTTLMDKKFFRRDQIWFVQKNEYGYSELSALSDFKVRSDASFEKDYLAGVYGGIPLLKDFEING